MFSTKPAAHKILAVLVATLCLLLGALVSSASATTSAPAFTIEKRQRLSGAFGEYATTTLKGEVGQTIEYQIAVKDTGNTQLTLSNFTDANCESISGGPSKALAAGESATYTCQHLITITDQQAGSRSNSATVTATPPSGQGSAITHTSNTVVVTVPTPPQPAFTIEKTQMVEGSSGSFTAAAVTAKVGQDIEYQIVVKDTGNTSLTFSSFTDAKCEGIEGGPAKALAPGESATYSCHHVAGVGSYENNATVTATPPEGQGSAVTHTSNTVTATVVAEPAFTIEKTQEIEGSTGPLTTAPLTAKTGQTVDYEIVAKDTGNTSLRLSSFKDANCEQIEGGPTSALKPEEWGTYVCHRELTTAGAYENSASVTATPPEGQGAPITHTSNTVITTVAGEPAFTIEKTQKIEGSSGSFTSASVSGKVGQTVDYQIAVKDTGNTSLTFSSFTDAKCEAIAGGPSKALASGESATYTCRHTLSGSGSYENSASVTATPPEGQGSAISHTSNTVVATIAAEPAFTIEKTQKVEGSSGSFASSPLSAKTGQTVAYQIVVKDTGNTALTFSSFTDAKCEGIAGGPSKALVAGESATYTCHKALAGAGSYENNAAVTATPPEGQGSAITHTSNTVVATVSPEPAFTVEKTQKIEGSSSSLTSSPLSGKVGQAIDYQVVVKDTGNTSLTFFSFTDGKCEGIEGGPSKALAAGESATYTCHKTLSGVGSYENTATVTASPPEGQGSAMTHSSNTVITTVAAEPAFTIEKTQQIEGANALFASAPLSAKLGQTVDYQIVVKDSGNTSLTFGALSDSKCEGIAGGPGKALASGEAATYTCHHTLTAIGSYENSASVTATPPEGQGSAVTHTSNIVITTVAAEPAFTIEKAQRVEEHESFTTSPLNAKIGQTVDYEVVVADTGNTSLTFGALSDGKCESIEGGPSKALSLGESATYTCRHTLNTVGPYEISASVTATPPEGQGSAISHSSNTVVATVAAEPAFTIEKTQKIEGSSGSFTSSPLSGKIGQTVDYQIVVKDTGNTSLTFSSFADTKCEVIAGGPSKALAAGESATYTCHHTLTALASYENNAAVTATPPEGRGSAISHTSNTVVATAAAEPAFTIEKTQKIEGSSGSFTTSPLSGKMAQIVDYQIVVKNTGNTSMTFGALSDGKCDAGTLAGGPSKALAPGEAATYTCHHTLTAIGSYENSASVTATPPEGQGSAVTHTSNTVITTVAAEPAFTIEKTQKIEGSSGSFTSSPLSGKVGQVVDYQIVVKDTGNTSLTFGALGDSNCEGIAGGPSKALAAGESATYTCHKALAGPGTYENTATVTATPPEGQGSPITHSSNSVVATVAAEPAFTIEKRQAIAGAPTGFTSSPLSGKIGQTVDYQVVVTDTGNTSLTFSGFSDGKCEGIAGGPSKALAPGESATYTCLHTLAAVGSYENSASVTATPPEGQGSAISHTSNTVVATVAAEPAFTIEKTQKIEGSNGSFVTSPLSAKTGQTVDYQVVVTDTGNTSLTFSSFSDGKCEGIAGGPSKALAPSESATYTCHHTVTVLAAYENTAAVTATPSQGQGSAFSRTSNTVVATVIPEPAFTIEKAQKIEGSSAAFTTSPLSGKDGQIVDYRVVVKDTGNTSLTFSSFTDGRCEAIEGGPGSAVAPGESATYTCHHTLSGLGGYENTATVTATPPEGQGSPITHNSNTVVAVVAPEPAFTIEKMQRVEESESFTASPLTGELEELAEYEIVVKNTGNTSLTFSNLTDTNCEAIEGGPSGALAPGESATYACERLITSVGSYENNATVTASPPEGQGSPVSHTSNTVVVTVPAKPAFTIVKTQEIAGSHTGPVTSPLHGIVGQAIDYQITVTDTGNTLMTLGSLADPRCDTGTLAGGPSQALVPGEASTYTCRHTITAADLAAGSYSNTATVTATPPQGQGSPITHASNTVVVTVPAEPALTIEQSQEIAGSGTGFTTSPLTGKLGQTVEYKVVVANTGDTQLTLGKLGDANCESIAGGPSTALAPGESATYTCSHTLSSIGAYENTATVTGTPPQGEGAPITHESNPVSVTVAPEPAFTIENRQEITGSATGFTTSPLSTAVGQTADYEIVVADTGNTQLTFATLSDAGCEGVQGGAGQPLAPGEAATYTCHRTLSAAGTYENNATVTATPPEGQGSPITHTSNTVVVSARAAAPRSSSTPTPGGSTTTPPSTGVLGSTTTGPTLSGPRGCVRGNVVISVKAAGVASVTFYLDGRKLKTLTAKDARKGKLSITLQSSKLHTGAHKVVAKIRMKLAAAAKNPVFYTRTLTFSRCGSSHASPAPKH
jgi:hypothetical protein